MMPLLTSPASPANFVAFTPISPTFFLSCCTFLPGEKHHVKDNHTSFIVH